MIKRRFPFIDSLRLHLASRRALRYWPRALGHSFLLLLQQPFHWIELLIWKRRIEAQQLEHPPIIILGYWRSGTTYLQRLLCLNTDLAHLTQYEAILPLGAAIHSKLLKPVLDAIVKILKLKHPSHGTLLTMDFPSEEDIALCSAAYPYTPMLSHVYPQRSNYFLDTFLFCNKDTAAYQQFITMHQYLTKRISFFNKKKQLVLKSPSNTAKIEALLDLYPQAKFIYLKRDPTSVYFSNIKLLQNNKHVWFQEMSRSEMDTLFAETYPKIIRHYEQYKHQIPRENLIELEFESFCDQPKQTMQTIYEKFGLANWENNAPKIEAFLKQYHGKERYFYTEKVPPSIQKVIAPFL